MAQYAPDCAPGPTILIEHDITFDLYEQLLLLDEDWELRRQLERWRRFEMSAWKNVSCVVTMSEKDRRMVSGAARVETLENGVDLERFHPSAVEPAPDRLLFIGSFAHWPNLLAVAFFVKWVWPFFDGPTLHVVSGMWHADLLDFL